MNSQKNIFRLCCFLLFAAIVATYSNHFNNSFHFDDSHTIENNLFIRDLKNIPRFFTDATTFSSVPANQSYRPVVSATLAVGYWLGNGSPFFFHLQNFWGLLVFTLLIYFLVYKIFQASVPSDNNRFAALIIAALFSLHPVAAETVNYIIARSDIISSVGATAGLVLWLYFPRVRKSGIYLLPVAVGMLAKPSAAMFAPILFITAWLLSTDEAIGLFRISSIRKALFNSLPAFIACGAIYFFIDQMTPKTWVAGGTSRWNYLVTQPYILLLYMRNFFFPFYLTADTDLSTFSSATEGRAIIGFLFLVLLIGIIFISLRSKKYFPIAFGLIWFLAAQIPTSVVPLAEVMNDHRMFFSMPGLIIAVTWLVYQVLLNANVLTNEKLKTISIALLLCLLCAFAYGTHVRNNVWHTEESLWKDVTEKSPHNGRGLMNYGLTLMAKGKLNEALGYFERAKEFTPAYPILFVNIAIAKGALGNSFEAENNFKIALDLAPQNPECNYYYARFLFQTNRTEQAKIYLSKTLVLAPAHLEAKNLKEQIEEAEKNLARHPTPEYFLNLSLQLYNEKKFSECIDACHKALQLKPDYAEAYNNICSAWNELREYQRAMQACDSALKINPAFTLAKNNFEYARKMVNK